MLLLWCRGCCPSGRELCIPVLLVGLQRLPVRWLPTRTPTAAAAPTRFVLGPSRRRGATRNRPNVHPLVDGCVEECSRRKEVPKRPPNSPFVEPVLVACYHEAQAKKVHPSAPISRGGSYRSASGCLPPAAALCSLFARRHATLRPRRRKNRYLSRSPKEPVRRRVRRPNRLQESATHPSTPGAAVTRRARAPKNVRVAQAKP